MLPYIWHFPLWKSWCARGSGHQVKVGDFLWSGERSSCEISGEVGTPDVAVTWGSRQKSKVPVHTCVSLHGGDQLGAVFCITWSSPFRNDKQSNTGVMLKWFTAIHVCIFKTSVITTGFTKFFIHVHFHQVPSASEFLHMDPSKSPGPTQAFSYQYIGTPWIFGETGRNKQLWLCCTLL